MDMSRATSGFPCFYNLKCLIFTLLPLASGCVGLSGTYSSDIKSHDYTKAYKLDNFLKKNKCIGTVDFHAPHPEPSRSVVSYKILNSPQCSLDAYVFMDRQCNGKGLYKVGRLGWSYCIDSNDRNLYSWRKQGSQFELYEPIKGHEVAWDVYSSRVLGYETSDEILLREKRETEVRVGKEKELSIKYAKFINGDPNEIKRSSIGTKICKIAGNPKDTVLRKKQQHWEYYIGWIERKELSKILVRYSFHGNQRIQYDDVNNLIRWESISGWWVCE